MATITSGEARNDDGHQTVLIIEPGDASRPTKKQRRTKSPAKKGRNTRKQEEFCQLNLDVLFLIAQHIEPVDLLNLAYTCKSLRGLLMNKMSEFVWRAARRQVGDLPDCPPDLSEPEYANLVFCARCHGCGKSAITVLWVMRRRYCLSCKRQRLCKLSSCKQNFWNVVRSESLTVNGETAVWVEKSQMESFLDKYRRSTYKRQFLSERREQMRAISIHACRCDAWHKKKLNEHKDDLAKGRAKRRDRIFNRLHQLGYNPEIYYFGRNSIRNSYRTFFWSSEPLTDQEWDQTWPVLHDIMDNLRLDRLVRTVYDPRRRLLADEYRTYMNRQARRKPTSDLLPHVYDLGHFGPFQSIIEAPESANVDSKSFAAAFQQLPDLLDEWKRKLEADLAEVVKTALDLPSSNTSHGAKHPEAVQTNLDILSLACALFFVDDQAGSYAYPDVFFVAMCDRNSPSPVSEKDVQRTGSIRMRFGIALLKEAPYIVRTCGLDPSVATVDDMDRLNARLKCLSCELQVNSIMNWRAAMWHARGHKRIRSQWKLVSNEHINAIEAVERCVETELFDYTRCLLCRPRVGDVFRGENIIDHLFQCHKILNRNRMKRGVHYVHVGICDSPMAEIVQGRAVTLRKFTLP